ncbi:MAG: polysaccharide biosynthesis tyrosine autokinase [Oscillatoriales cyanobacterium C42_A2020_001]|nr:polysaccharide biosynthesis tyrosine autokinase [Leptolyngbyaceae cyanobacterium C42_A2020_001]
MQAGQNLQGLPSSSHNRLDNPSFATADFGSESAEGKPKGGFKLRPILAILWRNAFLIGGVTAVAGGLAFLGYLRTPVVYEGNFTILVEPITSQARATDPTAISRAQVTQDNSSIDYPTLLEVLQSPELLSKIAAQIQSRYPEVSSSSLSRDLEYQNFTVIRKGTNLLDSTRTIDVTYRGTDPQGVQFILEKLAEGYLRFSLEDRKTRIGGGVEFIEDQLPALQQRVNNLESQIQAIRQRYRFNDPNVENQEVAEQLRDVEEKRLDAETLLREQATLYGNLQNQLRLTPEQGLAASALSQNPRYQDLLTQLKRVESQIAVSLARFNEESPIVQRLREQERNLNQLILRETGQILGQSSPGVPGSSQVVSFQDALRVSLIGQLVTSANQTKALQARINQIAATENELNRRLTELPALTRQYNTLQQQLDIATKTLNQFLLQRETLRVEAAQKEVPWEIISKPKLATNPVTGTPIAKRGKKALQMAVATLGAGVLLGVLAALLRERLRNVFVTANDLQDAVQLPFLGVIPSAGNRVGSLSNGKGMRASDPFLDAFSSLYTNLRFLNANSPVRSIAVSSVEPGDGKTTIALNLAQMASSMGQRVLLVDANFFAPQIHTLLDVSNQRGLTDTLRQKVDVEEVIQKSSLDDNLSVLVAGPIQVDATKLFASYEMQNLARRLQEMFDLVIYDTPALDGLTDVNFLAAQTDGLLMVVGVNKTKRSRFNETLEGLKKYRLPIVGVVANHTSRRQAYYSVAQQGGIQNGMPSAFLGKLKEPSDAVR